MSRDGRKITAEQLSRPAGRVPDVKLVGLGGVGIPLARQAALYLGSLEQETRLVLIDGDAFEAVNTTRMLFGGDGNKADVVRDDLLAHFDGSRLSIESIPAYVNQRNVERLVREGDVVLLAVDNHATRKLVGDHCARALRDVSLISGGNDGVGRDAQGRELRGTAGNCQVHLRRDGRDLTPTLSAYHPEIAEPADDHPQSASCTDDLESVRQFAVTNLMTAATMLAAFWLHVCNALHYPEVAFDVAEGRMVPIQLGTDLFSREK